jgi:3',5'-cyclic-AMP phosphodiesterase
MNEIRLGLGLLILLVSCKFNLSPYSGMTPQQNINGKNLQLIKSMESTTATTYKIAVLSDTHSYYTELNKAISLINRTGPYAFVFIAGDITNLGLLDEFNESRRWFNQLKFPYLVAVGNHDLLANGRKIFRNMFGSSDFDFTFHNTHFIFINNNNWESGGRAPDLIALAEILNASVSPYKVIVGHIPPFDTDRFSEQELTDWESTLSSFGVDLFIHGHNHNPGVTNFGTVKAVTVGSPSKKVFLEITVSPSGVSYNQISF